MLVLGTVLPQENSQCLVLYRPVKTECQNKLPYSADCLHCSRLSLFAWTKVPKSCREPEDAGPTVIKKEI